MAKPESVFIYVGTYPDEAAAGDDYQVIKDLHSAGAVGTYDAAVVAKDDDGKVHVNKDEMATRHGAWGGAAVGGIGGHLWRGTSRADVKEFGEVIDEGTAALVVVGESKIEQAVDKAALKAEKHVAKEIDVKPSDIGAAVREAAGEPEPSARRCSTPNRPHRSAAGSTMPSHPAVISLNHGPSARLCHVRQARSFWCQP